MRPWMRATSSSVRRRLPLRSALRSRTMSRPGRRTTGSRPGPTCRFQPPRPTTGRSGKTASSRMQEMPLARKLRAEKPQVRRARRYWASECSFHPVWGSAKPERTHSRTSSRLMCAVGTRRWSAQYLATLVLPAPAGPMSSTARVVVVGSGAAAAAGGTLGTATGAPGGNGTWPVVSGTGAAAAGGCGPGTGGGEAGPETGWCGADPGAGCCGAGARRGAVGWPGAGGGTGAGPWGEPGWGAAGDQPRAGPCPGWWGGGSGEPTGYCIRCHSVSYRRWALAAGRGPAVLLRNGTAPGRCLVNGRGRSDVPVRQGESDGRAHPGTTRPPRRRRRGGRPGRGLPARWAWRGRPGR